MKAIVKIELHIPEMEALRVLRDVVLEVDQAGMGIVSDDDPRRGAVTHAISVLLGLGEAPRG